MPFTPQTIAIYSVGLLGGSLGLALKHSGFPGRIIGLSSPEKCAAGLRLGCIDEGLPYEKLDEAAAAADLLVLCSPINAIKQAIRKLSEIPLRSGLVITDVGSTKQEIVAVAAEALAARNVHFIGGHPMAGSEKSGPEAADPYLFQNAIFVLTPPDGTPVEIDRDVAHFFERYLGCRTLFLAPAVHDRIVAAVSHLPHLLAVALVNEAGAVEKEIPGTLGLAAGGFRDMTRIASAGYNLWHDILSTNKVAVEERLAALIRRLEEMKQQLRGDALAAAFEQSRETRSRIPQGAKGFLHRLAEVLVVVRDQPGMIAAIANTLAENKINIKDIEVVKVREGEGGTIRLAFESPAVAAAAAAALQAAGINARERK